MKSLKPSQKKSKKQLIADDKKYIWHPFTQMLDYQTQDPLVISHGRGNYLYDIDGRKYFDGVSSLWVTVHVHQNKKINQAITKQLNKISHSTFLGLSHTSAIELAEKLMQLVPNNLKKIFYSDNGSTATEIAIKMAYQYFKQTEPQSKRKTFLTFSNAYHGDTLGSVSIGGIDIFHKIYKPLLLKTLVANFTNYAEIIKKNASKIAAVIIEPMIQGAAGMILQPPGFLKKLRALCDDYGLILIFDEVATGFGRTGKMFALEHQNVHPDILCVAKGLTGGYLPLAATITTQKIFDAFLGQHQDLKTFFHGHTYTANPLGCAAALANLELFSQNKVIKNLQPKMRFLKKCLSQLAKNPHVKEIRQLGLMVGVELCAQKNPPVPYEFSQRMGARVCLELRQDGIILRPLGDVIVLMPPLSVTVDEIDGLVKALSAAILRVCGS